MHSFEVGRSGLQLMSSAMCLVLSGRLQRRAAAYALAAHSRRGWSEGTVNAGFYKRLHLATCWCKLAAGRRAAFKRGLPLGRRAWGFFERLHLATCWCKLAAG